jgi:hypothetical protein
VMRSNERRWKQFINEILQRGISCGDFDRALDAEVAAEFVIALIRGLNFGPSVALARAERTLQLRTTWLADRH